MPKSDWSKNPIHKILESAGLWNFKDGEIASVLDVACGLSLKSRFLTPTPKIIIGVDIYEPYLKNIKADVPYALVKYDVRKLKDIFLPNSFDIVYAIDILEHLERKESIGLIKQLKEIAKKAIVIETPKGFIPQDIDIQGYGAHKYQTHRSGWNVNELESMGFKCTVRPYKMKNIKRHHKISVDPNVEVITGIYRKGE